MPTIAYLSNQFPSAVEPYVVDEIEELRARGFTVLPTSIRRPQPDLDRDFFARSQPAIYVSPIRLRPALSAIGLCLLNPRAFIAVLFRALHDKNEPPGRRARCLLHTLLGAYYASLLRSRPLDHIHVHHGYFGSWVALTASRLLRVSFSMTLHGSDLLLHPSYLASKLEMCKFCLTISQFNRDRILSRFPQIDPAKIIVQRLGVDVPQSLERMDQPSAPFTLLNVGRLHPVKDHLFLLAACRELALRGLDFNCLIAGDGPERPKLEALIRKWGLASRVHLMGHLSRVQLEKHYRHADLFVLTSRSEGIPIVLMEAMAYGVSVIAPAITGIPELVRDIAPGRTGFLYSPGSLSNLVAKIEWIAIGGSLQERESIRRAAHQAVARDFHRQNNLAQLSKIFTTRALSPEETFRNANPVLQQI